MSVLGWDCCYLMKFIGAMGYTWAHNHIQPHIKYTIFYTFGTFWTAISIISIMYISGLFHERPFQVGPKFFPQCGHTEGVLAVHEWKGPVFRFNRGVHMVSSCAAFFLTISTPNGSCEMSMCVSTAQARTKCASRSWGHRFSSSVLSYVCSSMCNHMCARIICVLYHMCALHMCTIIYVLWICVLSSGSNHMGFSWCCVLTCPNSTHNTRFDYWGWFLAMLVYHEGRHLQHNVIKHPQDLTESIMFMEVYQCWFHQDARSFDWKESWLLARVLISQDGGPMPF